MDMERMDEEKRQREAYYASLQAQQEQTGESTEGQEGGAPPAYGEQGSAVPAVKPPPRAYVPPVTPY